MGIDIYGLGTVFREGGGHVLRTLHTGMPVAHGKKEIHGFGGVREIPDGGPQATSRVRPGFAEVGRPAGGEDSVVGKPAVGAQPLPSRCEPAWGRSHGEGAI